MLARPISKDARRRSKLAVLKKFRTAIFATLPVSDGVLFRSTLSKERRPMRTVATLFLLTVGLSCGCARQEKPSMNETDRIQGEWLLISGERHGEVFADNVVGKVRLTFSGNTLTTAKSDGVTKATFTLHPEMNPKGIDVDMDGNLGLGIYKLDGNMLTLLHGEVEEPRPKDFEAIKSGNLTLLVLRKANK
jgi:uncharacterized protein (TIGR03067 family)